MKDSMDDAVTRKNYDKLLNKLINNNFFYQDFSFTKTDDSQDSRWMEGTIFYSTLPLPPAICKFACEMSITYFKSHRFYLPDCYSMIFTTLSNYHLTDWLLLLFKNHKFTGKSMPLWIAPAHKTLLANASTLHQICF